VELGDGDGDPLARGLADAFALETGAADPGDAEPADPPEGADEADGVGDGGADGTIEDDGTGSGMVGSVATSETTLMSSRKS
jgi:hypothetical protein